MNCLIKDFLKLPLIREELIDAHPHFIALLRRPHLDSNFGQRIFNGDYLKKNFDRQEFENNRHMLNSNYKFKPKPRPKPKSSPDPSPSLNLNLNLNLRLKKFHLTILNLPALVQLMASVRPHSGASLWCKISW